MTFSWHKYCLRNDMPASRRVILGNSMKLVIGFAVAVAAASAAVMPAHATFLDGTTIDSHFDALPGFAGYAGPTSTVAPGTVSPYPGINSDGTFSVTYADTSITILSAG